METLYSIIVVAVIVCIGFVLVPYLEKKGWYKKDSIDLSKKILKIVEILVMKYGKDQAFKDKYIVIHVVVEDIVDFVEVIATYEDNEDKKKMAFDMCIATLEKLGFTIDEDDKLIIEFAIESAVELLPPTSK